MKIEFSKIKLLKVIISIPFSLSLISGSYFGLLMLMSAMHYFMEADSLNEPIFELDRMSFTFLMWGMMPTFGAIIWANYKIHSIATDWTLRQLSRWNPAFTANS